MCFSAAGAINEAGRYSQPQQERMDHGSMLCAVRKPGASHRKHGHRSRGNLHQDSKLLNEPTDRKHDQLSFVPGGKLKVVHHLLNKKNNLQPGSSLLIELEDDFKPHSDLVRDHLHYKSLVRSQLRFPTTSGDKRHKNSSVGVEGYP